LYWFKHYSSLQHDFFLGPASGAYNASYGTIKSAVHGFSATPMKKPSISPATKSYIYTRRFVIFDWNSVASD
jgi:hypothetical protein